MYFSQLLSEADRMKEMLKKAMKSATAYNANLQKEKRAERSAYFDLQTMVSLKYNWVFSSENNKTTWLEKCITEN